MEITSPNTKYTFTWNDAIAQALSHELTPILSDMPAEERIMAMVYQIAFAIDEHDGNRHVALDTVAAELLGHVVEKIALASFAARRKAEAELFSSDGNNGNEACDGH